MYAESSCRAQPGLRFVVPVKWKRKSLAWLGIMYSLIRLKTLIDFCQRLDDKAQRMAVFVPEYRRRATAVARLQPFDDKIAKMVELPVRLA